MNVFLSYANEDKDVAERLARDLRERGVDVWRDKELEPGANWHKQLLAAISEAPLFVALVTNKLARSGYFSTELASAMALAESSPDRKIVPVIVDKNADLPPFLDQFTAIDATNPSEYQNALRQLTHLAKRNFNRTLPNPEELSAYEA